MASIGVPQQTCDACCNQSNPEHSDSLATAAWFLPIITIVFAVRLFLDGIGPSILYPIGRS